MFQAVDATRKTLAVVVTLFAVAVTGSPAATPSVALSSAETPVPVPVHHWVAADNAWYPSEGRASLLPTSGPGAGGPQPPSPSGPPLGGVGISSAQGPRQQLPPPADNKHRGIHVANWRWTEVGLFFTFTAFIVITGLAKVAFHHAHWLSSRIPESCLMIIVGVAVGGILYLCGVPEPENKEDKVVPDEFHLPTFTPRLFFLILLPPVILESAYSLYNRAFAVNLYTVLLYAVVGTLFNTFAIGLLLYGLSEAGLIGQVPAEGASSLATNRGYYPPPNIAFDGDYQGGYPGGYQGGYPGGYPNYGGDFGGYMDSSGYDGVSRGTTWVWVTLLDCLVFSALISAVDPVAVLAIFQEVGVNQDLYYLLFGESLLNDAVTVVLYTTMVTFAGMPEVRGEQLVLAVLAFFTVSLGGLSLGIVFGLVTALLTKTTREVRVVEPLAVLGIAYLSYLTAELFHFSGIISIIGCGLAQSHYALRNISSKSYTTVKYFTKMLSSTSDAIIFLFLGMVLVSDRHVWHTGFVIWTLVLCLVCRFAGVLLLTGVANLFRVKKINLQEQFIMGYGGLRGAIAFSLVEMLDEQTVGPRHVLLTTTLVVILFTIFFQGATIKPLVKLLNIEKNKEGVKSLNEEISDNVIGHLMAGIEEITGARGDFYIRRKWEYIDEVYLKRIFLRDAGKENSLTRLYEKLALTQHFAHLYGPVALVEDHKAEILHNGISQHLSEAATDVGTGTEGLIAGTPPSTPTPTDVLPPQRPGLPRRSSSTLSERFPGVQLRRRSPLEWPGGRPGSARPAMSMARAAVAAAAAGRPASTTPFTGRPPSSRLSAQELAESSEALRKAFRANPFQKYYLRYNRNLIDDECQELSDQLKRRHLTARRITHMAALAGRHACAVSDPALMGAAMGAGMGAAGTLGLGLGAIVGLGAPVPAPATSAEGSGEQAPSSTGVDHCNDAFQRPRRHIASELDGMFPEELEGIGVILARANQRAARQRPVSTGSSISAHDEASLEGVVTGDSTASPAPVSAPIARAPPPARSLSLQPTSTSSLSLLAGTGTGTGTGAGAGAGASQRGRSSAFAGAFAGAFASSPSESEPLLAAAGATPAEMPPGLTNPLIPKRMSSLAGITERTADSTPTSQGGRLDKDEDESSV